MVYLGKSVYPLVAADVDAAGHVHFLPGVSTMHHFFSIRIILASAFCLYCAAMRALIVTAADY
jgi:hypothetical protein